MKRLLTARRAAERRGRKGKGRAAAAAVAAGGTGDGAGDGASGDGDGEGEGDGAGEAACLGPRRVIIASATLDPAKLSAYFFGAPVLRVPGRCFPVQIFHASRPSGGSAALLEAAIELALRLHVEAAEGGLNAESGAQPATDGGALATRGDDGGGGDGGEDGAEGDILMFLTGQEEIETAAETVLPLPLTPTTRPTTNPHHSPSPSPRPHPHPHPHPHLHPHPTLNPHPHPQVRALAAELASEIPHLPRLEVPPLHATLPVETLTLTLTLTLALTLALTLTRCCLCTRRCPSRP